MTISNIPAFKLPIPVDPPSKRAYALKFNDALMREVSTLNNLIDVYNQASDENKIVALSDLKRALATMQHRFPNDLKQYYHPIYHVKIVAPLFDSIRQEEINLNQLNPLTIATLPEFIANLPQGEFDQLLAFLLKPNFTTEQLHEADFFTNDSLRQAFRNILKRYEIEVLGGHNSKNFKCMDQLTGKTHVMKVENRMNMPKELVNNLRQKTLSSVFTPESSEREGLFRDEAGKEALSRSILFTGFYPKGDLKKNAKTHQTVEATLENALYTHLQMGQILGKVEQENCCFPDMKPGNWLVDDLGQLRIADTKSFLHARLGEVTVVDQFGDASLEEKLVLNRTDGNNTFYSLPQSVHMSPPELARSTLDSQELIDVNRMHAYMLGKNLYQSLTGCSDGAFIVQNKKGEVVRTIHDANELAFNAPVFQTAKGKELERLIKQLIVEKPSERISLEDAMEALAFIKYDDLFDCSVRHPALVDLKLEVYQTVHQLAFFQINPQDAMIQQYITHQKEAIKNINTSEGLQRIQAETNAMLLLLKQGHAQNKIMNNMTQHLLASTTPNFVKKGQALTQALLAVPLIERSSIANGKTPAQKAVLREMESVQAPRFFGRTAKSLEEIQKFNEFKAKYQEAKPGEDLDKQEHLKPSN